MNEFSILDLQINLSYELWDDMFTDNDVDTIFNNFLNTYVRIVSSCFWISKSRSICTIKLWLMPEIKISCSTKEELCIKTISNNDVRLKEHCKIYYKILSRVISTAKMLYFSKIIGASNNKTKTTWKLIRNITGSGQASTNVTFLI
jgi:hypothetical protein